MKTYAIDDGFGNAITQGLTAQNVSKVAQRVANERGESVYYYEMRTHGEDEVLGEPDDDEYVEVTPE
jgi:hypothetical protein